MKLKFLVVLAQVAIALLALIPNETLAQDKDSKKAEEITIEEIPGAKDACFAANKPVNYNIDLTSTFSSIQTGSVACVVTDLLNKPLFRKTLPIKMEAMDTKRVPFDIPQQKAGFYRVNFIIRTKDYDDTVHRVFGVDVYNIHSPFPKPADFDAFWARSKEELARVKPEFKVTEKPDLSNETDQVFEIEMKSVGNVTIRGWMTLPKDRDTSEKLSCYVVLPGYWSFMTPQRSIPHEATFSFNVRGLGRSRDQIYPTKEEFITYGIEDKNKYIYRGAILDCIRFMDFINNQDYLDHNSVCVNGGSMGGYLSLALASLDDRVTLCTADNPSYDDYKWANILNKDHFPISDVRYYAQKHNLDMSKLLNELEYFDLKNFVAHLKARTIIGIGLLDNFVPPSTSMAMYNNIPASTPHEIFIYPNLTHEVGKDLGKYKGDWTWKYLGIEKKKEELEKKHAAEAASRPAGAKAEKVDEKDVINLEERPENKDAVFKLNSEVDYRIELKNKFDSRQSGTVSYALSTMDGKVITKYQKAVTLDARESKGIHFQIPGQQTGFYKINFMIDTEDYDDTVRRVFGVDIYNIKSQHPKPADFDEFWTSAKAELAKVEPDYKLTEHPELEKGNDQIFLVEMKSLGNLTIRAWLSLPKQRNPKDKLPVYLALPGFGAEMKPTNNITAVAYVNLNVRGLGNSRDVIHPGRDEYLTVGIENKYTYIYRGVLMDCVRAVDFICSRPELDNTQIFASGGSIGGFLSLALASIDHRIALCSADNPAFADFRDFSESNQFPMESFKRYAREHSMNFNNMLNTLDYYDLKNFVPNLKCDVVTGIGLLDQYAPPYPSMAMYNAIPTKKKLFIFPNLAHEVGPEIGNYVGKWMYYTFQIQ